MVEGIDDFVLDRDVLRRLFLCCWERGREGEEAGRGGGGGVESRVDM